MKKKNFVTVILLGLFFIGMFLWTILTDTPAYSDSERRVLAKFPTFSISSVWEGDFAEDFDQYAVERFPARDFWRRVKAYTSKILLQKDNHGIYTAKGHIAKLEYPMNPKMMDHAAEVMEDIYDTYLKNQEGYHIYLSIIPDKNRYLAAESGHLSIDYPQFSADMTSKVSFAQYIEFADLLEAEDYYQTDTHWRQEKIVDVAERLAEAMGTHVSRDYQRKVATDDFAGVYLGQSALIQETDTIEYLTNDTLEKANVSGASSMYDLKKVDGKDPYELFLSGNQPIVTIENPECTNNRRLILFRDSFGSSLAPLMVDGYEEIILVDLRYISSAQVGDYVSFAQDREKQTDVLFLYCTSLLNNSLGLK